MPSTNSRPKPDTSEDDLRPPYTLFTQPRRREFSGVRIAPVQTAPANIAEANFRELRKGEVRRIHLPRTPVNNARACLVAPKTAKIPGPKGVCARLPSWTRYRNGAHG